MPVHHEDDSAHHLPFDYATPVAQKDADAIGSLNVVGHAVAISRASGASRFGIMGIAVSDSKRAGACMVRKNTMVIDQAPKL
jgi:hypothetical protein